jgi:hypothetical protein
MAEEVAGKMCQVICQTNSTCQYCVDVEVDILRCRDTDVVEQIGHLRAQLLRSEQDKELMRIKLEEEIAEREKAQKQVG